MGIKAAFRPSAKSARGAGHPCSLPVTLVQTSCVPSSRKKTAWRGSRAGWHNSSSCGMALRSASTNAEFASICRTAASGLVATRAATVSESLSKAAADGREAESSPSGAFQSFQKRCHAGKCRGVQPCGSHACAISVTTRAKAANVVSSPRAHSAIRPARQRASVPAARSVFSAGRRRSGPTREQWRSSGPISRQGSGGPCGCKAMPGAVLSWPPLQKPNRWTERALSAQCCWAASVFTVTEVSGGAP